MDHKSARCSFPEQKAGQSVGAALQPTPLPTNKGEIPGVGSVRVAGGEARNEKTSTAALESFRLGLLRNQRRAPRHPAGATSLGGTAFRGSPLSINRNCTSQGDIMNSSNRQRAPRNFKMILPVILRITVSLLLWTLGVAAMDLTAIQIQPREHRVIRDFPVDRAKAEDLQRWVNAGHDAWCRDPQLVAAVTLRRVTPELAEYEPASLSLELEHSHKTKAIYTFHSPDGRTTVRITLRRYRYLLPTAGSLCQLIWIPESAEIVTRDGGD